MAWLSEGAFREEPEGGGTMSVLCLVMIVCFIWRFGLVMVGLLR
jgi:hypothetical protein